MSLSNIFTYGNLAILAFLIACLGFIIMYFENKLRDQNHKISSMVSLVSAMAEELNIMRNKIHTVSIGGGNISLSNNYPSDLINVSDDEEEDEDEEEEDEEDDDEDEEEDDDEDEEEESRKIIINVNESINKMDSPDLINKTVNIINIMSDNDDNNDDNDDDESIEDNNDLDDIGGDFDDNDINNIIQLHNEYLENKNNHSDDSFNNLDNLRNMNIIDYKKLPLNKLRSVITEKGLVTDSSKMKKPEMLKLLGIE